MGNDNEIKSETTGTSMMDLLANSDDLILECLRVCNSLYEELTSDSILKEETDCRPSCIMSKLIGQNDNLNLISHILDKIRLIIFERGI